MKMKRNNSNNASNPNAVPPDLLPEPDACRLAHRLQNNLQDGNDQRRSRDKNAKNQTRIEGPTRRWTPKRVFCCAGWIFCCPIYTLCWALREAPIDEEDLKEDECFPCYS